MSDPALATGGVLTVVEPSQAERRRRESRTNGSRRGGRAIMMESPSWSEKESIGNPVIHGSVGAAGTGAAKSARLPTLGHPRRNVVVKVEHAHSAARYFFAWSFSGPGSEPGES
jgi:hypothetical protein